MSNKIGRNAPCPCGSGRKYKFCCGRPRSYNGPPVSVIRKAQQAFAAHRHRQERRTETMGALSIINSVVIQDQRLVPVGNRIYTVPAKASPFPVDFYQRFASDSLGPDWFNAELQKGDTDCHPVAMLYKRFIDHQTTLDRGQDGVVSTTRNGPVVAWFLFCWDLFVISHYGLCSPRLLDRLKSPQQFQGARYEITVMALFLRAGFALTLDDESDVGRKHVEFIAQDKISGEQIFVEAKSRHRVGVLGYRIGQLPPAESEAVVTANVSSLLDSALSKGVKDRFVICIDLNMPELDQDIDNSPVTKELAATLKDRDDTYGLDANTVIFTNYPHHYGVAGEPDPKSSFLFANSTDRKPAISAQSIEKIRRSLEQYGYFPVTWDELSTNVSVS